MTTGQPSCSLPTRTAASAITAAWQAFAGLKQQYAHKQTLSSKAFKAVKRKLYNPAFTGVQWENTIQGESNLLHERPRKITKAKLPLLLSH
jgi:hypothetical protein